MSYQAMRKQNFAGKRDLTFSVHGRFSRTTEFEKDLHSIRALFCKQELSESHIRTYFIAFAHRKSRHAEPEYHLWSENHLPASYVFYDLDTPRLLKSSKDQELTQRELGRFVGRFDDQSKLMLHAFDFKPGLSEPEAQYNPIEESRKTEDQENEGRETIELSSLLQKGSLFIGFICVLSLLSWLTSSFVIINPFIAILILAGAPFTYLMGTRIKVDKRRRKGRKDYA